MPLAFHTHQVLGGNLGALGSLGADAGTTTTEPKSGSGRLWASLAFFGVVGAFVYAVAQNDRESQRTASNPAGERPRFFVALYGPWLRIDVAAPGWTKADYDAAHERIFEVAKTAVGGNVTRRGRWLRLPASDADLAMDAVVDSLRAQGMVETGQNIADLDDLTLEDERGNERAASVTEAMDAYDEDSPEEYASRSNPARRSSMNRPEGDKLRQGWFTIGEDRPITVRGWTYGGRWNGAEMPYLEAAEADRVAKYFGGEWVEKTHQFEIPVEGSDVIDFIEPRYLNLGNGTEVHVWDFAGIGWTWSQGRAPRGSRRNPALSAKDKANPIIVLLDAMEKNGVPQRKPDGSWARIYSSDAKARAQAAVSRVLGRQALPPVTAERTISYATRVYERPDDDGIRDPNIYVWK